MNTHANTLFVQTQGAYLSQDGETVRVKIERQVKLTVPLHHLEGIVCCGRVTVSPSLIAKCAERGVSLAYFTEHGAMKGTQRASTSITSTFCSGNRLRTSR